MVTHLHIYKYKSNIMKERKRIKYLALKKTSYCSMLLLGLVLLLQSSIGIYAQNASSEFNISGTVKDEKGQPIAGASITSTLPRKVIVSDQQGHYVIRIRKGGVLIFSSTGFVNQEIVVTGDKELSITMIADIKVLDEVFIGYQKLRKSDLTGAVTSVKAKELNLSTPTLGQALVGKVAGVQVSQVSGAPYS